MPANQPPLDNGTLLSNPYYEWSYQQFVQGMVDLRNKRMEDAGNLMAELMEKALHAREEPGTTRLP